MDKVKEFEELQQLKKEMMEEKEKAEKRRVEKKDDYLFRIITTGTKVEHHIGVYLPAAYVDTGTIMDHRLADIYRGYLNTISNFLRLFEPIEGEPRDAAVKEAIIKIRFVLVETVNNLVKPLLEKFGGSNGYPTQNISTFKKEWSNRIEEFKYVADRVYDQLDTKDLLF